jgi:hypothetical protein
MKLVDGEGRATKSALSRILVTAVLACCLLFSLLMAILKPIPHGHRYELAVILSAALMAVWALYALRPQWVFRREFLLFVLAAGLAAGTLELASLDRDPEIIHVYDSVFKALDSSQNPYKCGTIYHRDENRQAVYGNFNYPPMEITLYDAARVIAGRWNLTVLTLTILIVQALSCLILLRTFPRIKTAYLWPFFPFLVFAEFHTNTALTLLMTALILWAVKKSLDRPRKGFRYLVAILFGIGLTAKFLIIPLFASYYWHRFDRKRLRSLADIALEAGIALGTAVLIMVPYGVVAVLKNTVLFNLVLKDRAVLTTFYPNVLSGLSSLTGLSGLYPYAALAVLGAAILAAPRLGVFSAMLASGIIFLFVAPTPRTQFLSVILYLAVAGIYANSEWQGTIPAAVWKTGQKKGGARS